MKPNIFAVVVTYNRCSLLQVCISAIQSQSIPPDRILVIDNASTDQTESVMRGSEYTDRLGITYVRMKENAGGAGGFAEGIRQAVALGAEWIWMMDDDAEPLPNALEELSVVATDPVNVYGSLAISGEETAWVTTLLGNNNGMVVNRVKDVPDIGRVEFLPFLGFMVHRDMVAKIGLPDAGYFIAADDVEYCMRALRKGARVIVAGKSRIQHPKADTYVVKLPNRNLTCLRLPPWKRYYDTRNRLFIARKYYGLRLFTQTIPGSFLRLFGALYYEPYRMAQLWAFVAGFIDGLLGFKGRRHSLWGIR